MSLSAGSSIKPEFPFISSLSSSLCYEKPSISSAVDSTALGPRRGILLRLLLFNGLCFTMETTLALSITPALEYKDYLKG